MKYSTWEEAVRWLVAQPDQQELVRACYYDPPLSQAAQRYWRSVEWRAIRELLPTPPGRALEIGAGNGIASFALAKDGWEVCALEPDPSSLVGNGAIQALAQEYELPIKVIEKFGESLPFPDDAFDLVLARQVLHHARDLRQLCAEVGRVLRPGGVLVAVREHVITFRRDLGRFLAKHPLHHLYGGENAYQLTEYVDAIRGGGLTVSKVLGPFESVVNYAPLSFEELKRECLRRLKRFPAGGVVAKLFANDAAFRMALRAVSVFDHRAGRLYSFVARKPALN